MAKKYTVLIAETAKWDAKKQDYVGPTREVTLAQFRAEIDAANAKARAAYQANRARLAQ